MSYSVMQRGDKCLRKNINSSGVCTVPRRPGKLDGLHLSPLFMNCESGIISAYTLYSMELLLYA